MAHIYALTIDLLSLKLHHKLLILF